MPYTLDHPRLLLLLFPLMLLLAATGFGSAGSVWLRAARAICRAGLLGTVVLALSGPVIVIATNVFAHTTVVLDVSESVPFPEVERVAEELASSMGKDGVFFVLFALESELVAPTETSTTEAVIDQAHRLRANQTLVVPALQTAAASLPEPGISGGRLLLASDGLFDDREQMKDYARISRHPIDVSLVESAKNVDTCLAELTLPAAPRVGEPFFLEAEIDRFHRTGGRLPDTTVQLTIDEKMIEQRVILGDAPRTTLRFESLTLAEGPHHVEMSVRAKGDTDDRNDSLATALIVGPRPRALLVGSSAASFGIRKSLILQDISVDLRDDFAKIDSTDDLIGITTLILGPDRLEFTVADQALIHEFVSRRGGGLLVILDGQSSSSKNPDQESVLEDLLPITLPERALPPPPDPRPTEEEAKEPPEDEPEADQPMGDGENPEGDQPPEDPDAAQIDAAGPEAKRVEGASLSVLLVIDTSYSMRGGKLQFAIAAAVATARTVQPEDRIGILTFSGAPQWIVPMSAAQNIEDVENELTRLEPRGETLFHPAFEAARDAMIKESSRVRHVIFLTDGKTREFKGFRSLIRDMRRRQITVTTVGLGQGFDAVRLGRFADWGGGSFYPVYDYRKIPEIYSVEIGRVLDRANAMQSPEGATARDENTRTRKPEEGVRSTESPAPRTVPSPTASAERPNPESPSTPHPGDPSMAEAAPSAMEHDPGSGDSTTSPGPGQPITVHGSSPFLLGIDPNTLPPVQTFAKTRERFAAWVPLRVEADHPFLAFWIVGRGRVAVVTGNPVLDQNPDLSRWEKLPGFLAQTVRFLEGQPEATSSVETSSVVKNSTDRRRITQPGELRRLVPDEPFLRSIAEESGGRVIDQGRSDRARPSAKSEERKDVSLLPVLAALILLSIDFILGRSLRATQEGGS